MPSLIALLAAGLELLEPDVELEDAKEEGFTGGLGEVLNEGVKDDPLEPDEEEGLKPGLVEDMKLVNVWPKDEESLELPGKLLSASMLGLSKLGIVPKKLLND